MSSKALATAGSTLVGGGGSFARLVAETEHLLNAQRKKGKEYQLEETDPKAKKAEQDYIASILGLQESGSGGSARSPAKSPSKPKQAGGGGSTSSSSGEAGKAAAGFDAYDPKAVAEKELHELEETVIKHRGEASRLRADTAVLQDRYRTLQLDVRQLAYEDTVDEDRNRGIESLLALRAHLQAFTEELGETEAYTKTLQHMLRRSEEEKLSELAQLKAYEDALTVHRAELELAEGVQRQVTKARDEELRALQKLHTDVRAAVGNLDKKLEGRRAEVRVRQDKAKYRLLKLQEEMALKSAAEGILTPEQEQAMVEKARANAIEHDSLRMEKLTVVAEADQLEAEFASIRFAAGGRDAAAEGGGSGSGSKDEESFVRPDPEPVINRLAQLEEELQSIDETLRENVALLQIQQQQRGVLSVIKQPRAADALDEVDREVDVYVRLQGRTDDAKRAHEAAHRDVESSRSMRLHLEQSLASLSDRVAALPSLAAPAPNTQAERAFEQALGELEGAIESLPSAWARSQSKLAHSLMRKLHKLVQVVDPAASAAGAVAACEAWGRSEVGAAAVAARPVEGGGAGSAGSAGAGAGSSAAAALEDGAHGGEGDDELTAEERAARDAAAAEEEAEEVKAQAETDKRIDATIESLLVQNEWSVRVRPGSSGPTRPFKNITGKSMTEAVAAFERTWRGVAGAPPDKDAEADPNADPFGAEAVAQSFSNTARTEQSKQADGPPLDPSTRPRARDIQRYLAVAAAMVGDELDEGALAPVGGAANERRKEAAAETDTLLNLRDKVKLDTAARAKIVAAEAAKAAALAALENMPVKK